ncbi:F0F1 ATP synthase subunit delta [Rhodospirillaceae bacterium KN72]|uniref:ATP synthase subunit delta n=1 Tax=Pacificispira spongiicola TaxID=2729598 RepID=A0A7Y0E1Q5_9PROT|nr:F0F1 ATP synthase subunit delta [Pacificispira spongiicola]NMM45642.1 F0F1 ATP synthase subunit delta [Pacificispira spongiicola]
MAAKGGVNEIAGRYAKALFDLADEGKKLDDVAADLRTLGTILDESDDLQRVVRSPVISRADQGKAMAAVLDKLDVSDLTKRFVGYVAANRRLFALKAITKAYLATLAARRGEVTAEVASAKALSEAQIAAVEEALKKAVGGKVAVSHKVDPSLIGGLIVKVGSRMIDSSVSTQLQRLKLAMKGA